mmetsp:Transcript_34799/g.74093  ORF Transcript_34799/g.74093 Transcript_34799/m.74093 type:complete len:285 (-) Transcript_34799:369-1223(-)
MPYQSNPGRRAVEESYDSSATSTRLLLPDAGVNVGTPNSAMGGGTTTSELTTKFRTLNCAACLFVLLFHTLKIAFNPVRLATLISSPIRLMLEVIAGILALLLFLVEARVPMLGERALNDSRRLAMGGNPCIDLDVARGRALALAIIGASLGLINYLSRDGTSSGKGGVGDASGEMSVPSTNATDSGEDVTNANADANTTSNMLFIIIQCIALSPTTLVVIVLAAYTLYAMKTFPEYAESRAYSIQGGSSGDTAAASTAPSWITNVGTTVGNVVQGSGYEKVGA